MKIWLIGSDGMLGARFFTFLKQSTWEFVTSTEKECDITNPSDCELFLRKNEGITHIINCAAYTQVDDADDHEDLAFQVNAYSLDHLGALARKNQIWFLHFSTDYCFSGTGNIPYKELCDCEPVSVYGASKLEGERRLIASGARHCIVRLSWLVDKEGKNFVNTMIRLLSERDEISVVSDQFGRPSFCEDVVRACIELLLRGSEGIFHFANQGETSWFGFASEIYKQCSDLGILPRGKVIRSILSEEFPTKASRPAYSVFDTNKLSSLIGEEYFPSWKESLNLNLRQKVKEHAGYALYS